MKVSVRMVTKAGELRRSRRKNLCAAVADGSMALHSALRIAYPAKYVRKKPGNPLIAAYPRAGMDDNVSMPARRQPGAFFSIRLFPR
jgi:hypothetical protein